MLWGDTGNQYPQLDEALNLKICDLCGALNLVSDVECVVCRWRGHFERRPEVVRIALELNARQNVAPELRAYNADFVSPEDRLGGLSARLASFWYALRRRFWPRRY